MKQIVWFLFFVCCIQTIGFSQGEFVIQNKRESDKIRFNLINNLIIIPVEINGVALSFILDYGVNKSIVFNFFNITDTLQIKNAETVFLRGLGEGDMVEAIRSTNNISKIGNALNINLELYSVLGLDLDFTPRLGIPIHGIIGYDLFKDFVVEINYTSKFIRLTNPGVYTYKSCSSCETLKMSFYKNKTYIYVNVKVKENQIPVKLLIDTGGSDSIWLCEDDGLGIQVGEVFFEDFLGYGLTGSVYGKRSKIEEVSIKQFKFHNVNVSFPNLESLIYIKQNKDRNGSIAGNLLKRFNLVIDYSNGTIVFKKNKYFKTPFSYNKSGIELEQNVVKLTWQKENSQLSMKNFIGSETHVSKIFKIENPKYKLLFKPAYSIVELRKDSPAYKAGLIIGDVLLSLNNKSTDKYTLQKIMHEFYEKDGQRIKLKVERAGRELTFVFYLKDIF
ncbi:MAG: PDZ domain-containing protein, partial [Xanthomarina sp.]